MCLSVDCQLLTKAAHAVAYLVGQGPVEEQFAEVKAHFKLTCDISRAFSRCARCNCNVRTIALWEMSLLSCRTPRVWWQTFTSATPEEVAGSEEVPPKVRSHVRVVLPARE
jgi:uncharacterized protein with PIN domain